MELKRNLLIIIIDSLILNNLVMIMSTETPIILTPITQLKNTVIIRFIPKISPNNSVQFQIKSRLLNFPQSKNIEIIIIKIIIIIIIRVIGFRKRPKMVV